jgi:hypothetical protein
MYSPKLGRFLQTDPIYYADQMNMYAYVGNDPVNKIDPTGMNTLSPFTMSQVDANMREIRKTMDPAEFNMRYTKMSIGSMAMLASGGSLAFAAGALTFADGAVGGSVVSNSLQEIGVDTGVADGAASVVDLTLGGKGIAEGLGDIGKTFIFGKDAMELVPKTGMLAAETALTQYELKGNVGNVIDSFTPSQGNKSNPSRSDQGMSGGIIRICSGMGAEKGGCN